MKDVINHSNAIGARGVMIFGATIDHCREIMESLPNYNSGMINGEMGDKHNKGSYSEIPWSANPLPE